MSTRRKRLLAAIVAAAAILGILAGTGTFSSSGPAPSPQLCSGSGPEVRCGPYLDPRITMSNGHNTFTSTHCWAEPSCTYAIASADPSHWSVTDPGNESAGSRSVATYPNIQQLTGNWNGSGWGHGGRAKTPVADTLVYSGFTESMPHNAGTIAEFAYDLWTLYPTDVMMWTDNVNRGYVGRLPVIGTASTAGQDWTVYGKPGKEIIFSLDGRGGERTFANESSGVVDITWALTWLSKWFAANGYPAYATDLMSLGIVDAGWEVCSTGGATATFSLSSYYLTGKVRS